MVQKVPTVCCIPHQREWGVLDILHVTPYFHPEPNQPVPESNFRIHFSGIEHYEYNQAARHGICQMFYTNKIPEIFNCTRKKCVKSRHFGQKNENEGCFDDLSVFLQISTQIQNHFFLGKIPRKGNFCVNS